MNICIALLCLLTQQPISPNLAKALGNPALREASYSLPDGTIVIDPKKPKSPNLSAALQNPYLKVASYTLPDGTIIIDPRKPVSPNLSAALQKSALRNASFTLPEGVHDPNRPLSPNLAKVSYGFTLPGTLSVCWCVRLSSLLVNSGNWNPHICVDLVLVIAICSEMY